MIVDAWGDMRPSSSWSCMKSIDQHWLADSGTASASGFSLTIRFLGFMRTNEPPEGVRRKSLADIERGFPGPEERDRNRPPCSIVCPIASALMPPIRFMWILTAVYNPSQSVQIKPSIILIPLTPQRSRCAVILRIVELNAHHLRHATLL